MQSISLPLALLIGFAAMTAAAPARSQDNSAAASPAATPQLYLHDDKHFVKKGYVLDTQTIAASDKAQFQACGSTTPISVAKADLKPTNGTCPKAGPGSWTPPGTWVATYSQEPNGSIVLSGEAGKVIYPKAEWDKVLTQSYGTRTLQEGDFVAITKTPDITTVVPVAPDLNALNLRDRTG
jgi:hypothetical protein